MPCRWPTVYSLIYDPDTTEVLADEETALEPVFADAQGPLVISATVYLESKLVSGLPQ